MQVANETGEVGPKMSPSIQAALIESLFTNPAPLFAGALCAAIAALMTAMKTGNVWLWPCVAFLVITGGLRSLDMAHFNRVFRAHLGMAPSDFRRTAGAGWRAA